METVSIPPTATSRSRIGAGLVLVAWLVAAVLVGATGLLRRIPVPPPALAPLLTVGVLLILWRVPAARQAVRSFGLKPLVAVHLVRLVAGAYFLLLYQRGILPGGFALPAGWGDIAVAIAALPVLWWCLPVRTRPQRLGLLVWNAVGLVDILSVLANGARLFVNDPGLGAPFTNLPLAMLPIFVVPIVIVSHTLIFVWAPRAEV